jgi:peroxiredoxin
MSETATARAGERLPDFSLPDLSGRPLGSSDLRGSRAVIFCFASW